VPQGEWKPLHLAFILSARSKEGKPAKQRLLAVWKTNGLAQVLGEDLGSGEVLLGKVQAD
jgi:hypothetical protein